jgi:glycosyltransferase involved in cell wall biosynthesis
VANNVSVFCSRLAARLACGVIVSSPILLPYLPENISCKIQVILPGVDFEVFSPGDTRSARKALDLDDDAKYLLFSDLVGSAIKRHDIAEAVEREVQKHEPKAKLLLLQSQPYLNVPLYLNAADCLLMTSEKEGSPLIIKEALAVNLPIVSLDVGDVSLTTSGVPNCQIVDRNVTDLALAVLKAFNMDKVPGGRDMKKKDLDNAVACKKIKNYYEKLLEPTIML